MEQFFNIESTEQAKLPRFGHIIQIIICKLRSVSLHLLTDPKLCLQDVASSFKSWHQPEEAQKLWEGDDVREASVNTRDTWNLKDSWTLSLIGLEWNRKDLHVYRRLRTQTGSRMFQSVLMFEENHKKNLNAGRGAFQPFWPLGYSPTSHFQSTHSQAGRSTPQVWNSD